MSVPELNKRHEKARWRIKSSSCGFVSCWHCETTNQQANNCSKAQQALIGMLGLLCAQRLPPASWFARVGHQCILSPGLTLRVKLVSRRITLIKAKALVKANVICVCNSCTAKQVCFCFICKFRLRFYSLVTPRGRGGWRGSNPLIMML